MRMFTCSKVYMMYWLISIVREASELCSHPCRVTGICNVWFWLYYSSNQTIICNSCRRCCWNWLYYINYSMSCFLFWFISCWFRFLPSSNMLAQNTIFCLSQFIHVVWTDGEIHMSYYVTNVSNNGVAGELEVNSFCLGGVWHFLITDVDTLIFCLCPCDHTVQCSWDPLNHVQ